MSGLLNTYDSSGNVVDNASGHVMYGAQGGAMDQSNARQQGQLSQFGGQAITNAYGGGIGAAQGGYMAAVSLGKTLGQNTVRSGETFSPSGGLIGNGGPDPKSLGSMK